MEDRRGLHWFRDEFSPTDGLNAAAVADITTEVALDIERREADIALRLQNVDDSVFAAYDRLRAEGELREAAVVPGIVLAVAVVLNVKTGLLVETIVFAAVVALLVLFYVDGRRSTRLAQDLLVTAVSQGIIGTPTLDLLQTAQKK
jgi:lysylphosphatidylglycerol synthetase-like protein (DUF2156 family)